MAGGSSAPRPSARQPTPWRSATASPNSSPGKEPSRFSTRSETRDVARARCTQHVTEMHNAPFVYIVGAGPGDPSLLTVRGRECVAHADVILHDHRVPAAVMSG